MCASKSFAFAILLLISFSLHAADFRGSDWGDSKESVKEEESGALALEEDDTLAYEGSISGIDVYIYYTFNDGRLVQGAYANRESHMNNNEYIDEYKQLKKLLEKKYGEPGDDDVVWRNELYKDDPSGWGTAVSIGHLIYRAEWNTDRSEIITALRGDNFNVTHGVIYSEKATEEEREKEAKEKALEQL